MLPLRDENPRRTTPWVTYGLLAANVLAFAYQLTLPQAALASHLATWGLVPGELMAALQHPAGSTVLLEMAAVVTSMFLHGGWMHIGGNMLFLHIFGDNIEDEFGHLRYALFYLACGVAAGLAQVATAPGSEVPVVGASGAISGVLGAYMVLHPTARVVTLLFLGFFITHLRVPAFVFLGLWFALQSFNGLASLGAPDAGGGVAWFAHVGGFVAGIAAGLAARTAKGWQEPRRPRNEPRYRR
ncbi:MAG: rhomboid family intramembrane serine protease [Candidatus Sericytochromatia bacterium]|nr:rhomboid family intramembrane serine protease [Candidatus Sericytochromatia bacterium]MEB3221450.1 rhomboid family intramembrane serine protease [Candidatus Sericytochromatia bacterium]